MRVYASDSCLLGLYQSLLCIAERSTGIDLPFSGVALWVSAYRSLILAVNGSENERQRKVGGSAHRLPHHRPAAQGKVSF